VAAGPFSKHWDDKGSLTAEDAKAQSTPDLVADYPSVASPKQRRSGRRGAKVD
jgi:hypothetical protein